MPNFHKPGGAKYVTQDMTDAARATIDEYMATAEPYDDSRYKGRGIVMVAGGARYLACAYVNVRMIRANGCTLPIEIWHIGAMELDTKARELFAGMDVDFLDCMDVLERYPCRRVGGWEMNPYSIIHSRFREVLFLDADNIPLINLDQVFEWEEYQKHGAVFWPDYGRLDETRSIWKLLNIPYRDEPEFESGQMIVDKRRCWEALQLTMCLNEHSDVYYNHVWGDKETYHMAWRFLDQEYTMIPHPIHRLRNTMCQHDFQRNIILQHRNLDKFSVTKRNSRIRGFQREDECLGYLRELKKKWDGVITAPAPATAAEKEAFADISGGLFDYRLDSRKGRKLELRPDGRIGTGAMSMENGWYLRERDSGVVLYITGEKGVTATLTRKNEDTWAGQWLNNEMFPIELTRVAGVEVDTAEVIKLEKNHQGKAYVYSRTGFDRRDVVLRSDNTVEGGGEQENMWWMDSIHGIDMLFLGPHRNMVPTCMLQQCRDGIWRGYWTRHETMHIELIPKE